MVTSAGMFRRNTSHGWAMRSNSGTRPMARPIALPIAIAMTKLAATRSRVTLR